MAMQLEMHSRSMQVLVYKDWSGGAPNGLMKLLLLKWYINCGKCLIGWGSLNEFLSIGE